MSRELVKNMKYKKPQGFDPIELGKLLDEAYLKGKNVEKFMKKVSFSPSTVGYGHGTCPRYWYIAFNGTQFNDTFDSISVATMSNGVSAHERLQKIFELTGKTKEIERELKKSYPPIRGYADVVLDWDGKNIVGEIKTTNDQSFLVKEHNMKVSPNHLLQILIYMDIMETDEGFVLYENRNTQEILIIPIKMTEENREYIDSVYEWMKEVYKSWGQKELPKRPFRKNNKICSNCPVNKTCFEMQDGEKLIPVLKV
jgi:CRISPR/Cas system-associated exonuclease Cas4 (RecB family)